MVAFTRAGGVGEPGEAAEGNGAAGKSASFTHTPKKMGKNTTQMSPLVRLNLHTLVPHSQAPTDTRSKSLCVLVISVLVISVGLHHVI